MTQRPPFSAVLLRGFWLAAALYFAVTLSAAEWHYARGWAIRDMNPSLTELKQARAFYPFAARFRDEVDIRMAVFAETGK